MHPLRSVIILLPLRNKNCNRSIRNILEAYIRKSELIKADANVKKARVERKLTETDSETKKRRDASNQDLPDMSVREE